MVKTKSCPKAFDTDDPPPATFAFLNVGSQDGETRLGQNHFAGMF